MKNTIITTLQSAAKTALENFDATVKSLDAVLTEAIDSFKIKQVTLDELAIGLSKATDEIIISSIQNEKLEFLGGYLHMNYDNDHPENIFIQLQIYFQTINGKATLKETSQKIPLESLKTDSQSEIKSKLKITYNVEPPA
jgi:hypothetical protein